MNTYTVRSGDTLFQIAQKFYGDGDAYHLLAAYNQLADPNALEVGQVLKIPPIEALHAGAQTLDTWHNYQDGTIFWRVTANGVEIKGKGLVSTAHYTRQVERIWQTYGDLIRAASEKHGMPAAVIVATISTESSGDPDAYRYEPEFYNRYIKGNPEWRQNPYYDEPERISASYGLMQILYTTAYSVGFAGRPEDLYDPAANLDAGAAYIASPAQQTSHGWDPPKIACAYNAGSVRPTTKNGWGMYYYPGHLDRWIPSYNGAIAVIGAAHEPPATSVEPEPPATQPAPPPTGPSAGPRADIQLIFPRDPGKTWQPVIVDVFKHTDAGIGDPFAYTITTPDTESAAGYEYTLRNLEQGVYDLVFTDATSNSILYDIAEYEVDEDEAVKTLDLRPNLSPASASATPQSVTIRFRFPQEPGVAWKPLILDVFKHQNGEVSGPASYTIKIPEHGPDGGYIYDISQMTPGMYDFALTDAASNSVVQDIANYVVDQSLEVIDLRKNRAILHKPSPPPEHGIGRMLKTWYQKLIATFRV